MLQQSLSNVLLVYTISMIWIERRFMSRLKKVFYRKNGMNPI